MAMDVVQTGLGRPPVNRCLFGRPTAQEQASFTARLTQKENEAAHRFSRRWNFDVHNDTQLQESGRYHWIKVKSASDSDLPEFYARGYSHHSRRRPLTPSAGKSLTFGQEEGEGGRGEGELEEGRVDGPVPCMMESMMESSSSSSGLDVHLGVTPFPLRTAVSADPLIPGTPSPYLGSTSVPVITPSLCDDVDDDAAAHREGRFEERRSSSTSSSSVSSPHFSVQWSSQAPGESQSSDPGPERKRSRSLSPNTETSKRERLDSL